MYAHAKGTPVAALRTGGMRGRGLEHPDEAYGGRKPLSGGDTTWTYEPSWWQQRGEVPKLHDNTRLKLASMFILNF